jgi:hypothetical protein
MNYFGDEKPKEEKPKLEMPKKGQILTMEKAMQFAETNGLEGKEFFKFLEIYSPNTLKVLTMNPEKWKGFRPDPANKNQVPTTKAEIEEYLKYKKRVDDLMESSKKNDIEPYLKENKYSEWSRNTPGTKARGKFIIESAQKKGAKVEQQADGTYLVYDDETVFKETDNTFGKGRIIDPDATYDRVTYRKDKDLVNVYKIAEPPSYKNKIPTQEEITSLEEGSYSERALDPQYRPYYASVYFNPQNPEEEKTYGSQTNSEDLERFEKAKKLRESIMPLYLEAQEKKERKKRRQEKLDNLMDMFQGGSSGGVRDGKGSHSGDRANF